MYYFRRNDHLLGKNDMLFPNYDMGFLDSDIGRHIIYLGCNLFLLKVTYDTIPLLKG
jgi:hypothetical protein